MFGHRSRSCFFRPTLQEQPNLRTRLDDTFLLRFLRARKFDYDRALQLLLNYHAGRKAWPEVFQDLKPSTVKHVLDLGFLTVLPQPDPNGRYILCLRPGACHWSHQQFYNVLNMVLLLCVGLHLLLIIYPWWAFLILYNYTTRSPFTGKWKPNDYPFVDNVRAIYLTLEKLIQPEETQVNGIVILADYTGVGMSQASNPGPFLAKKVVSILQVRNLTPHDLMAQLGLYDMVKKWYCVYFDRYCNCDIYFMIVKDDSILQHSFYCHWKPSKIMMMWPFSWSLPNISSSNTTGEEAL